MRVYRDLVFCSGSPAITLGQWQDLGGRHYNHNLSSFLFPDSVLLTGVLCTLFDYNLKNWKISQPQKEFVFQTLFLSQMLFKLRGKIVTRSQSAVLSYLRVGHPC